MRKHLIGIFCQIFVVLPAFADIDLDALKARFQAPVANNGPNCYNTTLLSLGYMKEVIHVSPDEMTFYLNHFCQRQNIAPETAESGMVLVYRSTKQIEHTALLLGDGFVFEKYSYAGIRSQDAHRDRWRPGEYLFQPLSESLYLTLPNYSKSVFKCSPAEQVELALAEVKQRPGARRLAQLRSRLALDVSHFSPKDLTGFFQGPAVDHLWDLSEILKAPLSDELERQYMRVQAYSIYRQLFYMREGYFIDCPNCLPSMIQDFQNWMSRLEKEIRDKRG